MRPGTTRRPGTPGGGREYADWLIAIYDRWVADGRPARDPDLRFDHLHPARRGQPTEALGLGPAGLVVIETDGSYEQVDSLKVAFEGAPETGPNVFEPRPRHGRPASRHRGPPAGHRRAVPDLPGVPGRHQLRRRPVHPPLPGRQRLRQPVRVLRRPARADLPYQQPPACSRPRAGPAAQRTSLSAADFQALAGGLGDAAAMAQLIQAQRSLVRALLDAVYQEAHDAQRRTGSRRQLRAAWSVLTALDRDQPEALAACWATRTCAPGRCAAWNSSGRPAAARCHGSGAGHRAAGGRSRPSRGGRRRGRRARPVAAAVTVPVVDGAVHLPTLGRLVLGPDAAGAARLAQAGDRGRQRDQQRRHHPGR